MVSDRTTCRASIIWVIFLMSVLAGYCEETTTPIVINQSDEVNDTTTTTEEAIVRVSYDVDNSSVLIPPNYNKYELPVLIRTEGDTETAIRMYIGVALFIRRVLDVDTKKEVLTLDTDVALRWRDAKIANHLKKMNYTDPKTKKKFRDRSLDAKFLDEIWKPDIFIDEMVSSDKISLLGKLITLNFYAKGFPLPGNITTGPSIFVLFSRRTLKLRCEMDFHTYPADIQICRNTMRSYSHDEKSIRLYWLQSTRKRSIPPVYLNDPTDANFDISLDSVQPSLFDGKTDDYTNIQETFNDYREGNFSALRFKLKIRRKISYHVVQTYVPSVLLVLITWLCFILPSSMIEARIGISMTTLLTLTAMFSSIREQSPEVSYTMAIDMWMVFCIFEVFLALLLFTSIYWLRRRKDNYPQGKTDTIDSGEAGQIDTLEQTKEAHNGLMNFSQRYGFSAFALSFVAFFCAYWIYLLLWKEYLDFRTNPDFNNVGELGENLTEPYQCYNNRYIYNGDTKENEYTKCDEIFR